jgi:hypothetical protein
MIVTAEGFLNEQSKCVDFFWRSMEHCAEAQHIPLAEIPVAIGNF